MSDGRRSGRDQPGRPGSRGAGKSYSELRYQAGRGDGRGPRNRDMGDRGKSRTSESARPGSKGDGDKNKSTPQKSEGPSKPETASKMMSAADLEAQWQKEEDEKQAAERKKVEEEERLKREEEEKQQKEEEAKRQEEEDRKRKEEEEKKSIEDYVKEVSGKIEEKSLLRDRNMNADEHRPEESFFSRLDSSLKKNTAFVKKLKLLSESQKDSLTKDFNSLNLTKYVGEVASSVTEAKLKMSDIGCAVHICCIMHQRYADFSHMLLENIQKYFPTKKDEKISNPSKYRVDLRFFAELLSVGVFKQKEGLHILANQLALLVNSDKEEHNNLSILTSFCKHCGDDYAGLLPRKYRILAEKYGKEVPSTKVLPKERQKGCKNLLGEYYTSLCKHLVADHKNLQNMEKQNRKTLFTKGELSNERKEKYEEFYNNYQKLLSNTTVFADLMDEDMPELPEDQSKDDEAGFDIFNPLKDMEYDGDSTLWEDEETRTLYECLPDLRASIPGILYKDSEAGSKDDKKTEDESTGLEEDMENLNVEDLEREMETEQQLAEQEGKTEGGEDKQKEQETEKDENKAMEEMGLLPTADGQSLIFPFGNEEDKQKEQETEKDENKAMEEMGLLPTADEDKHREQETEKDENKAMEEMVTNGNIFDVQNISEKEEKKKKKEDDTGQLMKLQFDAYAQSLPSCVNRDLIDKAAIEFCMNFNTKVNRKKLVRALFTVHRTRYDLLPFYSRLVATLYPVMPDVSNDLVQLLKGDFRWHVRKKDQINIESKLKTVRFIGELVKYKMFPKVEALHCLKMLLFDFSHHNIEMACALLECSGRYLYRTPESHHRTRVYLDVMMRKKTALMMDSRYSTMIENAYFYSNPPDTPQVTRKIRPPLHEYIRKLLYKDLSKVTTEKVLRQIRKLNWDDEAIAFYTTKCMIAVWNIRYNSVHCAANLLAGIAPYHETVAIQVVDGVLEDIRLGMEINHPKYNQRRVSCAKYLGELYNYRMVESAVVFKTLYSFITFGVSTQEGVPSILDPPEHLFRIRLVCIVLETCGQYFDKGSSKKKLDCFLVYFQRYFWFKKTLPVWTVDCPFPIDVNNLVQDTLEAVRPKLSPFKGFEEACKACEELENEYKPKIAALLPSQNPESSENETDDNLPAIQEEGEDVGDRSLSQIGNEEDGSSQDERLSTSQTDRTGSQHGSQNQEDDGGDYEGDDDDMDYTDTDNDGEAQDEVVVMKNGLKHIECQEDTDFMSAFDKMMEDTFKARNNESLKVPQFEVSVPINLKKKKFELNPEPVEDNTIKFTLITKKGNRQQFADLQVPVCAEFATRYKKREEQERVEKEKMKQVVLGIHERQEEEDYQEMLASLNRPAMVNNNRERRVKYNHPKGAPDVDEIFGSK